MLFIDLMYGINYFFMIFGPAMRKIKAANINAGSDKIAAEVLALAKSLAGSTHAARRGKVEA